MLNQKKEPLISIIMNCLNGEKYLKEAIDSVYAQTYKNWEIVFWDNASTDKSAEIARSYDQRLRYFRSEETVPLGEARNWAIEKAKEEYIAFLDCDDVWLPEKLERQSPLLENNKGIEILYSNAYVCDENLHSRDTFFDLNHPYRGNIFLSLLSGNFVPCMTVIMKKKILQEAGGFNPEYSISEEYDLFLRIAEKGHEFDFIDEPLAKYRIHQMGLSKNYERAHREWLNVISSCIKRHPELLDKHKSRMKKIFSQIYYELAYNYFLDRRTNLAKKYLRISLAYSITTPKAFFLFLITFFGNRISSAVFFWLRLLKDKLKRISRRKRFGSIGSNF